MPQGNYNKRSSVGVLEAVRHARESWKKDQALRLSVSGVSHQSQQVSHSMRRFEEAVKHRSDQLFVASRRTEHRTVNQQPKQDTTESSILRSSSSLLLTHDSDVAVCRSSVQRDPGEVSYAQAIEQAERERDARTRVLELLTIPDSDGTALKQTLSLQTFSSLFRQPAGSIGAKLDSRKGVRSSSAALVRTTTLQRQDAEDTLLSSVVAPASSSADRVNSPPPTLDSSRRPFHQRPCTAPPRPSSTEAPPLNCFRPWSAKPLRPYQNIMEHSHQDDVNKLPSTSPMELTGSASSLDALSRSVSRCSVSLHSLREVQKVQTVNQQASAERYAINMDALKHRHLDLDTLLTTIAADRGLF